MDDSKQNPTQSSRLKREWQGALLSAHKSFSNVSVGGAVLERVRFALLRSAAAALHWVLNAKAPRIKAVFAQLLGSARP